MSIPESFKVNCLPTLSKWSRRKHQRRWFQRIIRVYHDDDNAAISLDYFSENIAILENDEDWNEEDHDDVKNVNPNPWEWAKEDFEELIL